MRGKWLDDKVEKLESSLDEVKQLWDKMGSLAQKTSKDMSYQELQDAASELSIDIFKATTIPTNLASQINTNYCIDDASKANMQEVIKNLGTISETTKGLAERSKINKEIYNKIGDQLSIAEESGVIGSKANNIKELSEKIKTEVDANTIESSSLSFIGSSLQDVIATAANLYDTAESMCELINSDPRELVIDKVKNELGDKITSSFGSMNSVTANISGIVTSALDNSDVTSLQEFGESITSSAKDFAADKLSDAVSSDVIDVFDIQNIASVNAGSINGFANILLETSQSCLTETFQDKITETTLSKLSDSSSELSTAAKGMIDISQQNPSSLDLQQVKDNFSEKLAESFAPINSVAGYASHLSETEGVIVPLNNSFADISQIAEDAASQIKNASEVSEVPQDTINSFSLMQDTAKNGGKLNAYGYSILSLVEEVESTVSDSSLLEEINVIKQGANEILDSAQSLYDLTQKDPRETALEELKNQICEQCEKIASPINDISDSTASAIDSGLLDEQLTKAFGKIKDNVSKAESSQSNLASTAQANSQPSSKSASNIASQKSSQAVSKDSSDSAPSNSEQSKQTDQTNSSEQPNNSKAADNSNESKQPQQITSGDKEGQKGSDNCESKTDAVTESSTAADSIDKPSSSNDIPENDKSFADNADTYQSANNDNKEESNSGDKSNSSDEIINKGAVDSDDVNESEESRDSLQASEDQNIFDNNNGSNSDSDTNNVTNIDDEPSYANSPDSDNAGDNKDKSKLSDLI